MAAGTDKYRTDRAASCDSADDQRQQNTLQLNDTCAGYTAAKPRSWVFTRLLHAITYPSPSSFLSLVKFSMLKRRALATGTDPGTARVLRGRCLLDHIAPYPINPVAASGDRAGPRKETARSTGSAVEHNSPPQPRVLRPNRTMQTRGNNPMSS